MPITRAMAVFADPLTYAGRVIPHLRMEVAVFMLNATTQALINAVANATPDIGRRVKIAFQ